MSSSTERMVIPTHNVTECNGEKTIDIGDWHITAKTNTIVTASEADELQKTLGFPLPEMTFGSNSLILTHSPSQSKYIFDTPSALKCVKSGELGPGDGSVKVKYADEWLRSRTEPGSTMPLPQTVPTKKYDWTYTSAYTGHSLPDLKFTPADPENSDHAIPLAELTRPDPILFYAEIPLFEDELHDNGSSHFLVRIRVMPGCIFVLSRFTLRVDNVLFRTFDTRMYHSFLSSPPLIVRECSGWEAPYDVVKRYLPKKDDLTPLTDPNFIGKVLSDLPKNISQRKGAETGWRALGTKTEVSELVMSQTEP